MIRNYFKIAWRNLKENSLFSGINILGLSLGFAIAILLFLFIRHEQSFDSMYAKNNQIYRLLLHETGEGEQEIYSTAPAALAPSLTTEIPSIKKATRLFKHNFGTTVFIKADEKDFTENNFYYADSEIFDIFDIELINGNATSVINSPNTVTLSQSTATKYFGNTNPIGKLIKINNETELEITGIFKDFPKNSTLDCNAIASFSTTFFYKNPTWNNVSFETYCLLNKESVVSTIENKIQNILNKHVEKENQWYRFSLQPLHKIHLYSSTYSNSYSSRNGDYKEVRNLSILAIIILLIACINYINLTTARSQKRSKDVGVNKTLGASTRQLFFRFYIETGLITFISLFLGILFAVISIPFFNTFTANNLSLNLIFNFGFILNLFAIWLVITLISGAYPALYLSRFSPKNALNPSFKKEDSNAIIRKGLVVTQFVASIILIVSVIVTSQQLNFIKNKDLGYSPENVMAISTSGIQNSQQTQSLIDKFKTLPNVIEASMAQGFPGMNVSGRNLVKNDADKEGIKINTNRTDAQIAKILQLNLLAGKMLPKNKQEGDTLVEVVLNKKAVDYLGISPEEAIGKKVSMQLGRNAYVLGVVDNFNFASLHEPIGAYAFHNKNSERKSYLLVRFKTGVLPNLIEQFKNTFKVISPDVAFEYSFLEKNLEKLYAKEQRTIRVGMLFSILTIFVACLGLFGLVAFTTEQRKKEIGIRKVLGASVLTITKMLSIDFLKLVLISLIIAFPIAFWVMNNWLQEFAYRININLFTFLITGLLTIGIALLTVSFQSIKAAMSNPVKSLKTE